MLTVPNSAAGVLLRPRTSGKDTVVVPAGGTLRVMRMLAGLFLLAHGLVHFAVWLPPFDPDKSPFDPKHSWLLARTSAAGDAGRIASALAVAGGVTFVVAGIGVLADAGWAPPLAIAAALLSLVLTVFTFNRWLWFNVAINVAIIAVAV
jgi:hypothetical protein